MRIGVNARLLEKAVGIGQYTLNLYKHMAEDHPEDEFVLVTRKNVKVDLPNNVSIKVIPEKKWIPFASLKKGYWEQIQVPKFFKKEKLDVIHYTYPASPLKKLKTPSTVTVHDTIPWDDKRYTKSFRSKIYFWLTKRSLKKEKTIIAVSETSKRDLLNLIHGDPKRVHVTYEAASESFAQNVECRMKNEEYLIYVGGYDVRKNVPQLIEIFEKISPEFLNLKLLLVSGEGFLQKNVKNSNINILTTGFVEEQELAKLYRGAKAFINISEKEGFNLPILEAAYSETPILTSDIPLHRELYDPHVLFLPLQDQEKAATLVSNFIKNPKIQKKLREETKKLREKYTWEEAAKKTYEILTTLKCSGSSPHI